MEYELRPLREGELERFGEATARGFNDELSETHREIDRFVLEPARTFVAVEGERIIGTATSLSTAMRVPGAAWLPVGAVTAITVQPTHRRRGVLGAMMRKQLADLRAEGVPLAALWASESGIYGRFGYGMACPVEGWRIERTHAALRAPAEPVGTCAFLSKDEALATLPAVYEQVATRPGTLQRPPHFWRAEYWDAPEDRDGYSPVFWVAYREAGAIQGYAAYRVKGGSDEDGNSDGRLRVRELVAATPAAATALWRFLFGVDLVRTIEIQNRPLDDALPWMLADPRRLQRRTRDGVWLRLVDVPRALSGRGYAAEGSLTLAVNDATCAWNAGTYRLECPSPPGPAASGPLHGVATEREGGATCRAGSEPADLALDVADLGAAYLGGVRFSTLARAGRVEERTPGALGLADAMFAARAAPQCLVHF